jgi:hypothetical protein
MNSNGWSGAYYSAFRFVFGAYLLIHFLHLVPYASELFSRDGMIGEASLSPLYPIFPNPLFIWDMAPVAIAMTLVGAAASVAFAIGARDRIASLVLWFVWACLYARNPLIANPGLPYVGWLLLAHSFLPSRPQGSWDARGPAGPNLKWRMPQGIYVAAWIAMSVGYSYSGATKLVSPSWIDGTAILHVLSNPLARPTFLRETLLLLPMPVIAVATWGALATELLFGPLSLVARLRPFLWLALLAMHFGLMTLIDFSDLSAGMVMLHLFTFDPNWLKEGRSKRSRSFDARNSSIVEFQTICRGTTSETSRARPTPVVSNPRGDR